MYLFIIIIYLFDETLSYSYDTKRYKKYMSNKTKNIIEQYKIIKHIISILMDKILNNKSYEL
ncbi:hypothetical protein PFAG_02480 [Plasmodium falciparum Santa Lucia]|uniref:Uncharacterized protein n=6 Tax=Plasmodium falciparum TaxID=5833 RepID=W4IZE1_PLAFP|nr:hypothetical protein PFFCH_05077 [Plasmodium falciparum FCH/4]ETW43180.1 hypothetical protein PFNF135_02654 [Plasmodium falciparum NF135/5.C10]ETW49428.1 hypothetical protein PFMALIP_02519 [Plasmodium falciparum MaliPS096_E11]ETW55184.1 hypothetical protein PFUGPA_03004 [Plasmodium falciparum Palo Alto/Uganda]ETW61572.1 hypothetical protein PFMC_02490 [Plasmodium falciparum CAMP/Malaysia]EUT86614.1 hypothetical protein PFAG_02480 [Plasmodium falciparum Santa Lucia]